MIADSKSNFVQIHNKSYKYPNNISINKKLEQKIIYDNEDKNNIYTNEGLLYFPENKEKKQETKVETKNATNNENKKFRNKIEDILFSQLSDIKIQLLNFDKNSLPKIDTIQLTLLNQSVPISDFKNYGYGIYLFFYYLKSLLFTFGVFLFLAFYYIYKIFFKYYNDYEEEYSLFFDYNLLSVFRKYYIETHGKEEFLEKYKNFDVFYIEYSYVGIALFAVVIIINFIFLIIAMREYRKFKNKNITNYNTLIFSGSDENEKEEIIESTENKDKDINNKKVKILSVEEIKKYCLLKKLEKKLRLRMLKFNIL